MDSLYETPFWPLLVQVSCLHNSFVYGLSLNSTYMLIGVCGSHRLLDFLSNENLDCAIKPGFGAWL